MSGSSVGQSTSVVSPHNLHFFTLCIGAEETIIFCNKQNATAPANKTMWNKFLGKKSGGGSKGTDGPSPSRGGDDDEMGGDGGIGAQPPAEAKLLTAVSPHDGRNWSVVRILVNDTNVSPPSSGVEDNDDDEMEVERSEGEGKREDSQ